MAATFAASGVPARAPARGALSFVPTREAPSWRPGVRSPTSRGVAALARAARRPPPPAPFDPPAEGVWCDPRRVRLLRGEGAAAPTGDGPVVYWMSRDQRADDNWALYHALALANRHDRAFAVLLDLPAELRACPGERHRAFLLGGLRDVRERLRDLGIPFALVDPSSSTTTSSSSTTSSSAAAARFAATLSSAPISLLVTDYSPLRDHRSARRAVALSLAPADVPVHEVDARNVVPAWAASDKLEYAARTIRRKITDALPAYLTPFPSAEAFERAAANAAGSSRGRDAIAEFRASALDLEAAAAEEEDRSAAAAAARSSSGDGGFGPAPSVVVGPRAIAPGARAAREALASFLAPARFASYVSRNDPNVVGAQSGLSPYLRFGHLSAQRVALEANLARERGASEESDAALDSFLEELIVRRELAENHCAFNPAYDALDGAPGWARESLALHASDPREHAYSRAELERAETHDELWNAAQLELTRLGKQHGFMRMYWAKKILEWTPEGPAYALETAIGFNDRYSLDGGDPNGYAGCMWAVAGTHDQGWKERDVFGKVRYMNYAGCKRKFKVAEYVARIDAEVAEELDARKRWVDEKAGRTREKEKAATREAARP